MPKYFLLSEKVKVLDIRKEKKKLSAGIAKICSEIKTSIHKIVKRKKKYVIILI